MPIRKSRRRRALAALAAVLLGATALPAAGAADCPTLLDHAMPALIGGTRSLCEYRGKVVLAVNTASRCGYTPQYEGLEALYKRYKDRGLVVLGFPSDDFGKQEPGSNQEIAEFCRANYGVSFPMYAKSRVAKTRPNSFYAALAVRGGGAPRWNFHKYVIDRSGEKVSAFGSAVEPSDPKLVGEIERLLAAR